ncbi:MAG: deiodinase-like protein [Planctomycetota bacterium]
MPTPTPTPTPAPAPNAAATAEQDDQPPAPRRPSLVAGSLAPDFTLSDASGANPVALRSLRGKPTVLVFGSCTCPQFVRSTRATGALYQRYQGRVNFLMVYGREAHPTDGWAIEGNRFKVTQPTTIEERRAAARGFVKELGIAMPLVVDTIEGDAERLYDPFPNRVVVIDAEGRIAHIGARGPQSTLNSAREVPVVLDGLLAPR